MPDESNEITSGMYFIVAYAASGSSSAGARESDAKVLCRRGGPNTNANSSDMVVYKQDARSIQITSSVYVSGDEVMIYAPMLNGTSPGVAKNDIFWPVTAVDKSAEDYRSNNPKRSNWYEYDSRKKEYVLTNDTKVNTSKTYYTMDGSPYPNNNSVVKGESYTGSIRQLWKLEAVPNKNGWYAGDEKQAYMIVSSMSSDDRKMVMATSANASGSTVKIVQHDPYTPSESEYWLFVKQDHVPDGFYNIRLATSTDKLLIGKSDGTVTLEGASQRTDNGDVWFLQAEEENPALQWVRNLGGWLRNKEGGYLLIKNGQNVNGGRPNTGRLTDGGHYDMWAFVPHNKSNTYNDSEYQAYDIVPSGFNYDYWAASRYVLCGYSISDSTKTISKPSFQWLGLGTTGDLRRFQWFLTWAHAYNPDLTVPSKLAVNLDTVPYYDRVGLIQNESIYPSWIGGNNANWQLRYRITNYRRVGDSNATNRTMPSSASSWKSILDDETNNDGWGDMETPNCSAVLMYNEDNSAGRGASGRYVGNLALPGLPDGYTFGVASGNVDKYVIWFDVRAWEQEYSKVSEELSCHGGSASHRFTVAFRPTVTLSTLKADAYGIYLTYTSNLHRGSNTIRIESQGNAEQLPVKKLKSYKSGSVMYDRILNQSKCENGQSSYTGKYYFNYGGEIPSQGDEIPFTWTINTVDDVTATGSTVLTFPAIDMSDVVTVACPVNTIANARMLKIDAVKGSTKYFEPDTARCTLVINNRPNGTSSPSQFAKTSANKPYLEYVDIPRTKTKATNGDEYFAIPYPFGKPFKVEIVGGIVNDDRIGMFEYYHAAYDSFRDKTRMWNYGKYTGSTEWFEIFVNEGDNPTESVTTQYSSNAVKTTERDWEIVQFGNTPEQTRSVAGVVYPGIGNELIANYPDRIEEFSKCKYAWYRSFDGEVMRVAITSVRETRLTWGAQVSVEMRRTDV